MPLTSTLRALARSAARWPQAGLLGLVHGYRLLLKPWIGNTCRFEPSCSAYALDALRRHGALQGSTLAAARILRCHPWCDGGLDPVPDRFTVPGAGLFSRLGLPRGDDTSKTRNPS